MDVGVLLMVYLDGAVCFLLVHLTAVELCHSPCRRVTLTA